ncbi:MAG: HAD family phosphatase [Prevotella sp.]|nr:HAD family phosphatase [Prevotella sp.]
MMQFDYSKYKCALFDLDGVVFDTEPQYSIFWQKECRYYHPEQPGLEQRIKGMVLTEIFNTFFKDVEDEWGDIVERLNSWESSMDYEYIAGFEDFINQLKLHGVKTAVVTSSNREKMKSVYRQHPQFKEMFDVILTAEDFDKSKPDPDCYLKGMARFGCKPDETVVFEDSVNGLKSGKASGALLVGLCTTNPEEILKEYTNLIIYNYL